MPELTLKELAEQLRRAATAAEIHAVIGAIAARRKSLRERLTSIEDKNGSARRAVIASADTEALARLNAEAEMIDDELGLIAHLDARAFPLHTAAVERETIEAGQRAHKRIASLIATAADALAKYEAARQLLQDSVTAIGAANMARDDRRYLDDALFRALVDAMQPAWLVRDEHRAGAAAGLARWLRPPPKPNFGEPAPDPAEQVRARMRARRD